MPYRADIEGLRAVSVILVLLFHLGLAGVPGGFVGVDVFFVTSGYLISGILLRALQAGTFSLASFYERRVRRILPALVLVIAASLIGGYILLFPGYFNDLGISAVHALLAVSNVYFYLNTGYFDGPAELAPLLHTWSLGVEEQFYLVWPLLLAVAYKASRGSTRVLAALFAAVVGLSFAWNLWQVTTDPKAAFYLPFARAWELALGALLVLAPGLRAGTGSRLAAESLAAAGLAMIGVAALTISSKAPYPGTSALLPVIGAALLIYQSGSPTIAGRLLSLPPLVLVGKLSYSLYLWHWPLIVYWRHYVNGAPFTPTEMLAITVASFAAAWLSWRLVEMPYRYSRLRRPAIFATAGAASALVGLAAAAVVLSAGVPDRLSAANQALGDKAVMWEWACPQEADITFPNFYNTDLPLKPCVLGADWNTAPARAVLWGDSNSQHLYPLLHAAAKQEGMAIATIFPCPAIIHMDIVRYDAPTMPYYNRNCTTIRDRLVQYLSEHNDVSLVILAASWTNIPGFLHASDADQRSRARGIELIENGLEELLPLLRAKGRRIVLFADFPNVIPSYSVGKEKLVDPVACVLATQLPRRSCDLEHLAYENLQRMSMPLHDLLRRIAASRPDTQAYFPEDYICSGNSCLTWLNGEFLYRDSNHIRRNLRADTVQMMVEKLQLRRLLKGPG